MEAHVAPPAEREVADSLVAGLRAQLPATFPLAGIEVAVGELVEIDHTALTAALAALLPGVEVRLSPVAALYRCLDCGVEYPADEFPCPACGSGRHEVVHGHELGITRAWGR